MLDNLPRTSNPFAFHKTLLRISTTTYLAMDFIAINVDGSETIASEVRSRALLQRDEKSTQWDAVDATATKARKVNVAAATCATKSANRAMEVTHTNEPFVLAVINNKVWWVLFMVVWRIALVSGLCFSPVAKSNNGLITLPAALLVTFPILWHLYAQTRSIAMCSAMWSRRNLGSGLMCAYYVAVNVMLAAAVMKITTAQSTISLTTLVVIAVVAYSDRAFLELEYCERSYRALFCDYEHFHNTINRKMAVLTLTACCVFSLWVTINHWRQFRDGKA